MGLIPRVIPTHRGADERRAVLDRCRRECPRHGAVRAYVSRVCHSKRLPEKDSAPLICQPPPSRKAGLVRPVIPAAPPASALPACGALRVIFNSLKVPLSTSVLSHDGALLDGVVLFRGMLSRTSRNSERSLCHIAKRTVVSSLT